MSSLWIGIAWALALETLGALIGVGLWFAPHIVLLCAILIIIAGALYYAVREIQAQTARNSHRHFGGV